MEQIVRDALKRFEKLGWAWLWAAAEHWRGGGGLSDVVQLAKSKAEDPRRG